MKKLVVLALFLSTAFAASAQFELKLNPIGTLFGRPDLSAEIGLPSNFGVEVGVGTFFGTSDVADIEFRRSGLTGFAAGKYYFNSDKDHKGFTAGLYTDYRNIKREAVNNQFENDNFTRRALGVGLLIGLKAVGESGFLFETDLGLGRNFLNRLEFADETNATINLTDIPLVNLNFMFRVALGYRF